MTGSFVFQDVRSCGLLTVGCGAVIESFRLLPEDFVLFQLGQWESCLDIELFQFQPVFGTKGM